MDPTQIVLVFLVTKPLFLVMVIFLIWLRYRQPEPNLNETMGRLEDQREAKTGLDANRLIEQRESSP